MITKATSRPFGRLRASLLGAMALAILLSACASSPGRAEGSPEAAWKNAARVKTTQGYLSGSRALMGVRYWLGVPYAQPPLRDLRWKAPREMRPWTGTRSAWKPGGMAVQLMPLVERPIGTEDCLTLNLWRPADGRTGLPVYVWIHGGANSSGYSFPGGDYDGSAMAREHGFLFVSLNYRLGPLGWLMDGDLADDAPGGNLGLLDIIAALRWIKANAAAFGGDPGNVTVAGESAGASNILALLLCERARGLFHRAILQSPLDLFSSPARARKESFLTLCRVLVASRRARDMAEAGTMLDSMSAEEKASFFRSRPASEFLRSLSPDALGMYAWPGLVLDGELLPREGLAAFASGDQAVKVPLIMGYNRDEVGVFLYLSGILPTRMGAYYRTMAWGSAAWGAWVEGLARTIAAAPGQPAVRLYRFDWGSADESGWSPLPGFFGSLVGAFHSLEIPFFLGNDTVAGRTLTGLLFNPLNEMGRKALSRAVRSYTAAFARDIEPPEDPGLPPWTPLSPTVPEGDDGMARGIRFGGNALQAKVEPLGPPAAAERLAVLMSEIGEKELAEMLDLLPAYLHPTLTPR